MKNNNYRLIVFTISLLFLLSIVSGYNIKSPFEVNLDIALMLTPYGIFKNFVFSKTYLTPYYWEVTLRNGAFDQWNLLICLVALETSLGIIYVRFLKASKND